MSYLNVVPAYGNDYRSKAEVEKAFFANKDFRIQDMSSKWNGSYINKTDAVKYGVKNLTIRYSNLRKVHVIKVEK